MKVGDTVYIIENRIVKPVKVVKITRDFITIKYDTYIPDGGFGHMKKPGGIRLRRSRIFETEKDAEMSFTRAN